MYWRVHVARLCAVELMWTYGMKNLCSPLILSILNFTT
jgi:hypothetical protein